MSVSGTPGLPPHRQWLGAAVGLLGLPLLTGHWWRNATQRTDLTYATPVLLVLLAVVAVALVGGLRPTVPSRPRWAVACS